MSQFLEFEGKNIEAALEAAGQQLAKDPTALHYDVISYGSSGIFGLVGTRKARIKVKVDDNGAPAGVHKEAKQEARDLVRDAFDLKPESPERPESPESTASQAPSKPAGADVSEEDLNKAVEFGTQAVETIVNAITDEAQVSWEHRSDGLLFRVEGGNSAVLIGKRGQTLEAIQYLTEKIVNKQAGVRLRVLVDVKGYLGTRKANLKKLALRMAEKAVKSNKSVTVGQMNAYERRIVHMTLKDMTAVRTQSVGEGYYRKLIIFPKKRKGRKNHGAAEH